MRSDTHTLREPHKPSVRKPTDVLSVRNPRLALSRRSQLRFAALVMVALGFRVWALWWNGFGNLYYAGAVRSMSQSWHNFFYNSFDPVGVMSIDKGPLAYWIQTFVVKVFGYHGLSLLLPQVAAGVGAVAVVYVITRRVVGEWGGLLAGLVMAITPAAVAVDRSNLGDSWLLLFMLLATYGVLRAVERGSWRWLLLAAVFVGLAFNVKMRAALGVVPALLVGYLAGAPRNASWTKKIVQVAAAAVVLAVISIAWATAVDLTPAASRPYVDNTTNDSALSLTLGLHRPSLPGVGPGAGPSGGPLGGAPGMPGGPQSLLTQSGPRGSQELIGSGGNPGLARLANRDLAGHITWLIPLAVLGLIAVVLGATGADGYRRGAAVPVATGSGSGSGQDSGPGSLPGSKLGSVPGNGQNSGRGFRARRGWEWPLSGIHTTALVLAVWLATYVVIYSWSPPPVHPYYMNILGAPIACLAGMGVVIMRRGLKGRSTWLAFTILAVGLTAVWEAWVLGYYPAWRSWLLPALALACVAGLSILAVGWAMVRRVESDRRPPAGSSRGPRLISAGLAVAAFGLLMAPAAWSLTPALSPDARMVPVADPVLIGQRVSDQLRADNRRAVAALVGYLNSQNKGERIVLASTDIHYVAPVLIATGEPVVAWGGFQGNEPGLTLEEMKRLVESGELRFALLGTALPGPGGLAGGQDPIAVWVRENGEVVDPREWRSQAQSFGTVLTTVGGAFGPTEEIIHQRLGGAGTQLYDLGRLAP